MIVEDDDDHSLFVVSAPRRVSLVASLWDEDSGRADCSLVLVVHPGEAPDVPDDVRVVSGPELGAWMLEQRVAVRPLQLTCHVMDPSFIEAVAGLDT